MYPRLSPEADTSGSETLLHPPGSFGLKPGPNCSTSRAASWPKGSWSAREELTSWRSSPPQRGSTWRGWPRRLPGQSLRIATEDEVEQVFGDCERARLPPFGRLYGLTTLVDASLSGGPRSFSWGTHDTRSSDALPRLRGDRDPDPDSVCVGDEPAPAAPVASQSELKAGAVASASEVQTPRAASLIGPVTASSVSGANPRAGCFP